MKKAGKFFGTLTFLLILAFFLGGPPVSLFSQTIKEGENYDQAASDSTPAKTEVQAKEEQENAETRKVAPQAPAEAQAKAGTQKAEAQHSQEPGMVLKTYSLKYISLQEFVRAAKLYIQDYSGSESSLTVRIFSPNIPAMEDLLKKLDVEKRNIQFQVYTIIASKELPSGGRGEELSRGEIKEIENKDLRRVLDEMKGLWNFKHFWVDAPSFLTMKDGSGSNSVRLVGSHTFFMDVERVQIRGEDPGKRTISVGQIRLSEPLPQSRSTLMDTSDITFKEKGYLVVGVSGFASGWRGAALILVINAEIK